MTIYSRQDDPASASFKKQRSEFKDTSEAPTIYPEKDYLLRWYSHLKARISYLRKINPAYKYRPAEWSDAYFDGSYGLMRKVEFWRFPSEDAIDALIARESRSLGFSLVD
jgi:hypothetical protein